VNGPSRLFTEPDEDQIHRGRDRFRGPRRDALEVPGQVDLLTGAVRPTAEPTPLAVRERDPDTSVAAAVKAATRAKRSRLRADILKAHQANPAGLTDDQLDELLVDDDRGTIARRRKDLVVDGILEDSGMRRRTRRNADAIVWRLR
jgi:hypothetical protein